VTTFQYNHRNQMTHAEKRDSGGTLTWSGDYAYDALGNRFSQNIDADGAGLAPAVLTKFAYDQQGNAWADLNSLGVMTDRRLYLDAVDALFARIGTAGDIDHYLTDRQGSARGLYRAVLGLHKEIDYDAFGKITHVTGSAVDRYGYTGRELEEQLGLLYYRARWYSFDIGRFTGEDPLKFGAGDFNVYRYVGNSPTNGTDPSGLWSLWDDVLGPAISSADKVLGRTGRGWFTQTVQAEDRFFNQAARDVPIMWDYVRNHTGEAISNFRAGWDIGERAVINAAATTLRCSAF
jgi:RHS repeat-associated protein